MNTKPASTVKSLMFDTLESRTLCSASPAVVGYLPDYFASQTQIANMDWSAITELNYFSVKPNGTTGDLPGTGSEPAVSTGRDWSVQGAPQISLTRLTDVVTAAHAHNVSVDIVVGGAGLDGSLQSIIEGSDQLHSDFADSVQTFANTYHVDGVDLDWEPSNPSAAQVTDYGNLIQTLQTRTTIRISAAVAAKAAWQAPNYDTQGYVLDASAIRNLDRINVMDYDLGNPGDGAPIQDAEQNMTGWAAEVAKAETSQTGSMKSKLTFGVPFYGRATMLTAAQMPASNPWSNANDNNTSTASYADIVNAAAPGAISMSLTHTADQHVTESVQGTFNGANSTATWNLDGRGTIAAKTTFALQNNFGGVMIWALGHDYVDPTTGLADDAKSLMPALKGAYTAVVGHVPNPVTTAPAPTLSSIVVNDGAAQRSQVKKLTVSFDRPVTLATGAFKLARLNNGGSGANDGSAPTDASAVLGAPTSTDGGKTWDVTFVGGNIFMQIGTSAPTGSLVDGIYRLTVDASEVTSSGVAMTSNGSLTFHRLFGDTDGNKTVNNLDYGRFRTAFTKGTGEAGFDAAFDFDGNGAVNNLDYAQFRTRFTKVFAY